MNIFSFIKSKVSIEAVVADYVTLKKAGIYLKGTCPFHGEKTASFTVSPHKEIFYCFGCNAGGDVITFISKIENCSQLEAAHHLAQRYNVEIPEEIANKNGSIEQTQHKNRYYQLCQEVAKWAHEKLLKSTPAMNYLRQRGMNDESIKKFSIGYFPGGPRAMQTLIANMQRINFLTLDLIEANILLQGKSILYSPFEERIIFPIKDHLGRYCGFGGRIFNPKDDRAKYYNSRENELFTKGNLVFGLDLAKKEIQKTGTAYLVEGYTDCIALAQHGYPNTIATLGTACTQEHLRLIARYAHTLFVLYDGDPAGQKAIIRLTELCWDVNLELKVIPFAQAEDPASFCAQGGDIQTLIAKAQDIFAFFIQVTGTQIATKTLHDKMEATHKIISMLARVKEPFKREFLVTQAAQTLHVPANMIKEEISKHEMPAEPKKTDDNPQEVDHQKLIASLPTLDRRLFAALMNNFKFLDDQEYVSIIDYLAQPLRMLIARVEKQREQKKNLSFIEFFDTLHVKEQLIVNYILLEAEQGATPVEYLREQFQKKHWKTIANDVKEKLQAAERAGDIQKVSYLITQFQELKKKYVKGT